MYTKRRCSQLKKEMGAKHPKRPSEMETAKQIFVIAEHNITTEIQNITLLQKYRT